MAQSNIEKVKKFIAKSFNIEASQISEGDFMSDILKGNDKVVILIDQFDKKFETNLSDLELDPGLVDLNDFVRALGQ